MKLLERFIVKALLPISTVDCPEFRKFISPIGPNFKTPCRQTMKSMIIEDYKQEKEKIKQKLVEVDSIALTFDEWTSVSAKTFLSVIAHFKSGQVLKEILLSFVNMSGKTSAENIAEAIRKTVHDFNIADKIVSITTDNAANCTAAVRLLDTSISGQKPIHLRCAAHSVNLIVKKGLKLLETSLSGLRKVIHSIRSSPKKMQELENICKVKGIKFFKIKNDVPTRWNSTYLMLESIMKMRDALEHERAFAQFDFDALEELVQILSPFYELTELLSGSTYISLGLVMAGITNIENMLGKFTCVHEENKQVVQSFLDDIAERFLAFSDLQLVGLFFDVRLKFDKLPDYISQSDAIERIESFFRPYIQEDDIEVQQQMEKQTKLTILIFGGQTKPNNQSLHSEIVRYLSIPQSPNISIDVIKWWEVQKNQFPKLYQLSQIFLICQATSVAPERIFSKGGELITKKRNCLSDSTSESLLCLHSWL